MMISRPCWSLRIRRSNWPSGPITVMISVPSGRITMVRVSPPTTWVWISRAPKRNRSVSSWRMNSWPPGSRTMIRPGSVMIVRPPSWVSCRALRKSSRRRGPAAAAPGAIGVSAWAGRGMAGSGAATVGGARRSSGARPGGSAVCPPGAAFGAAGAAFGVRGGGGGAAGPAPAAGGVGAGAPLCCCWAGPGLGGVGGFGGAGGGAAAGGAGRCGGAAAGGGTGRAGGAAAGGAGRCGGAAAGGAGRCCGAPLGGAPFGGAPLGASLGGALGFPSGPSSSCACATTSGAVCAWDGGAANCIAVKAVVASSTRRSFIMMICGLRGGEFSQQTDIYRTKEQVWRSTAKR
jgi:hypothetical protein